jgi:hypothetical protein
MIRSALAREYSVLDAILQIWKIHLKQLSVTHEIPDTIPEDYTVLIFVLSVWFLHVAVLQTKTLPGYG